MLRNKLLVALLSSLWTQVLFAQTVVVRDLNQQSFAESVPSGNYSGITHIGGNNYAVVSDKSATAGFYVFRIDIDSVSGRIKSVINKGFYGDTLRNADCEGIVYVPETKTFFISCESDNSVAEYSLSGLATGRRLAVPSIFHGCAGNYGLEALAFDEENRLFWIMNESPIGMDGRQSTSQNGVKNMLRLQAFGMDLRPRRQFVYRMDAPTSRSKASNYVMGVSEIASIGKGRILVLEREAFVPKLKIGAFVRCKLYEVVPDDSLSVAIDTHITADTKVLPKRLLYTFTTKLNILSRSFANYEGMCLGPKLADGSRTLILVSDSQNNYGGVLKDWFKVFVIR